MSIPKVIHYCWFGRNTKSELIEKCINSWKEMAPDYIIKEWNEDNFNIEQYTYASQAYNMKKYAFVADVARFHILNEEGGIYLDTDVELLKPIDDFMNVSMILSYDTKNMVNTGLIMGSVKEHFILRQILNYYNTHSFILPNGRGDTTTVVTIVSEILEKLGIEMNGRLFKDDDLCIYPSEYFDPYDFETKEINITNNTHSIHHYAATWKSKKDMLIFKIGLVLKRIVGNNIYKKIAKIKHRLLG